MREERGGGGRGGGRGGDKKDAKGGEAPRRGFFRRRRVCKFCAEKIDYINYKDVRLLAPFLPERGKIQPRRISGTCALHQRKLQVAIKRARQLALIPYVHRTSRERLPVLVRLKPDATGFGRNTWKSSSESTSTTWDAAATS